MQDKFADPLDEATALAASMADAGVEQARRANMPETHPDFDGESCVSCGDTIPDERLAMGRVRCVVCQTKIELRNKQHARGQAWGGGWPSDD